MVTNENDNVRQKQQYETPTLVVKGSIAELTQGTEKKFGVSDGFTFMGVSITFAS